MHKTHPKKGAISQISLCGGKIDFRLISSRTAKKLKVRVGMAGVEVIRPEGQRESNVSEFMNRNGAWVVEQLQRVERLRGIRRPCQHTRGQILFRGEPTNLRIHEDRNRLGANRVIHETNCISIICTATSVTPPWQSLENWPRKQARSVIHRHLSAAIARLQRQPVKVLIMGQRTKWGNCSVLRNLSFNWRLIMAPDDVLRYMVIHEAVHLAIPDHSQRFWLTVRSLCPETERARQWLCANEQKLLVDLPEVCSY